MLMNNPFRRIGAARPARSALFVRFAVVLLAALFALPAAADEPSALPAMDEVMPFISTDDIATLAADGQVLRFHENEVSPVLLPETSLTSDVVRQIVQGDLNIGIEGLFFTPAETCPPDTRPWSRTREA